MYFTALIGVPLISKELSENKRSSPKSPILPVQVAGTNSEETKQVTFMMSFKL